MASVPCHETRGDNASLSKKGGHIRDGRHSSVRFTRQFSLPQRYSFDWFRQVFQLIGYDPEAGHRFLVEPNCDIRNQPMFNDQGCELSGTDVYGGPFTALQVVMFGAVHSLLNHGVFQQFSKVVVLLFQTLKLGFDRQQLRFDVANVSSGRIVKAVTQFQKFQVHASQIDNVQGRIFELAVGERPQPPIAGLFRLANA
jgi:hypothetical protein